MGLRLTFPTLLSKWCFTISPVSGLPGQKKHLQVACDGATIHLCSFTGRLGRQQCRSCGKTPVSWQPPSHGLLGLLPRDIWKMS